MFQMVRLETAPLYEVRAAGGVFHLYFKKKNGFKFKKAFGQRDHAVEFALVYLRHCCLACQQRGQVYKLRGLGGVWATKPRNKPVFCPECGAEHGVFPAFELALRCSTI